MPKQILPADFIVKNSLEVSYGGWRTWCNVLSDITGTRAVSHRQCDYPAFVRSDGYRVWYVDGVEVRIKREN